MAETLIKIHYYKILDARPPPLAGPVYRRVNCKVVECFLWGSSGPVEGSCMFIADPRWPTVGSSWVFAPRSSAAAYFSTSTTLILM